MLRVWLGAADAIRSSQSSPADHASWRRGRVAARRARAAARAHAADWHTLTWNGRRCVLSDLGGAFLQGLALSGWSIGQNVWIDTPDRMEGFRRSAGYVNRILRGEKPGDLPFQQPTKYELMINRTAATALGLELSPALLALADEVIE
jgi:hypothetical protein